MSSMKKLDFFGNWKMAQSAKASLEFLESFKLESNDLRQIAIFPSFVHISSMAQFLITSKQNIFLGGQDCSSEAKGAFTAEISAEMLRELKCQYVLVGHSERRLRGHESDQSLRAKLDRAFEAKLTPVYCVGETESQRNANQVFEVLDRQLGLLASETRSFILAYEPVWAIGTGRVASLNEIDEAHTYIWSKVPKAQSLLYGGSVKPDNAKEILKIKSVTGLLVGGASLKAPDFTKIIESA